MKNYEKDEYQKEENNYINKEKIERSFAEVNKSVGIIHTLFWNLATILKK